MLRVVENSTNECELRESCASSRRQLRGCKIVPLFVNSWVLRKRRYGETWSTHAAALFILRTAFESKVFDSFLLPVINSRTLTFRRSAVQIVSVWRTVVNLLFFLNWFSLQLVTPTQWYLRSLLSERTKFDD